MDIKNVYNSIIFTSASPTIKDALAEAIKNSANLCGANLRGANLRDANLRGANLCDAYLCDADLRDADLCGANLRDANLCGANLCGANLRGANLCGANLCGANLRGAKDAGLTIARLQFIPQEGLFIGWKKCKDNVIVKLQIPAKAKRSHGSERKCRASEVKVLEVFGAKKGISLHDGKTEYVKGEIVKADKWDEDRWNTCSSGIHFYLTRLEAEAHQ
jgi:hypothetical protein